MDRGLRDYHETNMQKLVIQDYCIRRFEGKAVDPANAKGL